MRRWLALALELRFLPLILCGVGVLVFPIASLAVGWPAWIGFGLSLALVLVGVRDFVQTRHAVKRNYPILANIRYVLEKIRPEIRQYFLESETDGTPFNRSTRAIVYQRAKMQLQTRPFGTQLDVYDVGHEWLSHSIMPAAHGETDYRVRVGGPACARPYDLSIYNISAMSFGSLSANAILALGRGARAGAFAQDTGEGGVSRYHREAGADLIWEIGSGYFGCRTPDGRFDPDRFAETATDPQVKMIEVKLSQGAKPGHGGMLPGRKVTPEIAAARGVPVGVDCVSPARHSAFSTPIELMGFIAELRRLSGGKPVGFKLCIGQPHEFASLCKAMLDAGVAPDFIVVDGSEGGTGAAPLEFTDHVGMPLREGLRLARNMLVGAGLKPQVRLGASGKIVTAFDIARAMALGADWCNAARGYMMAVGCIQSLACHTDRCPTGVATQDPLRQRAIVVPDKAERVENFHRATRIALGELIGAAGLGHPGEIRPEMLMRRISSLEAKSFAEIYEFLEPEALINGNASPAYQRAWSIADPHGFTQRETRPAQRLAAE
jgi:glutamate synthase domain-containing protein 2